MTPVDANKFKQILDESGYDREKTQFLFEGFSKGFDIRYKGPLGKEPREAPNLK